MKPTPVRLTAAAALVTLACATPRAPETAPPAIPAPEAMPSAEAAPSPEAAPAPEARPAPESIPAPEASTAESASRKGDLAAQCANGGAGACVRLCAEEADVCAADDKKKECNKKLEKKAEEVDSCARTGFELGKLCRLEAREISPTQAAVGRFAADCKASAVAQRGQDNLERYLLKRAVPMVVGPAGQSYITDRHHTSTAVLNAGIDEKRKRLFMCPMADRQGSGDEAFWSYMEANNFAWLRDREGEPIEPRELPPKLTDIGDDPYRTLSRWVRDSCGYIKCGKVCGGDDFGGADTGDLARCKECPVSAYFLEFRWADFLRRQIVIDGIYDLPLTEQGEKLRGRLADAMAAAASPEALNQGLPGWNDGLIEPQEVRFDAAGCDE